MIFVPFRLTALLSTAAQTPQSGVCHQSEGLPAHNAGKPSVFITNSLVLDVLWLLPSPRFHRRVLAPYLRITRASPGPKERRRTQYKARKEARAVVATIINITTT